MPLAAQATTIRHMANAPSALSRSDTPRTRVKVQFPEGRPLANQPRLEKVQPGPILCRVPAFVMADTFPHRYFIDDYLYSS